MVGQGGVEPPTRGFSVLCSTSWATGPCLGCMLGVGPNDLVSQTSIQNRRIPYTISGGQWWIRTTESRRKQIYSLPQSTALPTTQFGARDRSRTGTALRPRDFKSLASTNFATRAELRFKKANLLGSPVLI